MSITFCEFHKLSFGDVLKAMYTIAETRRLRVEMLIKRFKSAAALNSALGWTRTDPKIAQIRNANIRPDPQKPYQMGDAMAREIENTLLLERGWMDTPPTLSEQYGHDDSRVKIQHMVQQMPPEDWPTAVRLLSALQRPEAAPILAAVDPPAPDNIQTMPQATPADSHGPTLFKYKKVNQTPKQPSKKSA